MEYGLIGEKLGHSYSKEIHGKIGTYDYEIREIPRDGVAAFMQAKDFKAINVTIPYKETVIPFLSTIDKAAQEIGSVNTVVNCDGVLHGHNTDFLGMRNLILSMGLEVKGRKVLILGTGGTSKTARAVCKDLQASEIVVVSRKEGPGLVTYEQAVAEHADAQIIMNTTPVGMFPRIEDTPISLEPFARLEGVVDMIYNPHRTRFVLEAQARGLKAQGGLRMLVDQAIAANEFFFDHKVDPAVEQRIFSEMVGMKRNIVLVGMPGSGKTTVGKVLATELGMELLDTDDLVIQKTGRTPADIVREDGEPAFRDIEAQVCADLAVRTGCVISTGGGAILRSENVRHLKNNGEIFFIDRDLSMIRPTEDRPLTSSVDKLKMIYETRYPLYLACADHHIVSDNNVEHTVAKIIGALA